MRYLPGGISTILLLLTACGDNRQDSAATPLSRTLVDPKYQPYWEIGYPNEDRQRLIDALPYREIYFERQGCYGTCPSFNATLRSDGSITYVGKNYVDRVGTYTGNGSMQLFGKLCCYIEKYGIMQLNDEYYVAATDLPGCTIKITDTTGGIKEIRDYGLSGPVELWMLQGSLDQYLSDADLEKVSDETESK